MYAQHDRVSTNKKAEKSQAAGKVKLTHLCFSDVTLAERGSKVVAILAKVLYATVLLITSEIRCFIFYFLQIQTCNILFQAY